MISICEDCKKVVRPEWADHWMSCTECMVRVHNFDVEQAAGHLRRFTQKTGFASEFPDETPGPVSEMVTFGEPIYDPPPSPAFSFESYTGLFRRTDRPQAPIRTEPDWLAYTTLTPAERI